MEKSPDAFRTISEVAEWLDTPAHVLRFWESRFTQIKPVKRAGGRRYYRPSDMALLGGIKKLLHDDGMTIRGVQKILREEGVRYVAALSPAIEDAPAPFAEMVEGEEEAAEVVPFRAPARRPAPAAPAPGAPPREPAFDFDAPARGGTEELTPAPPAEPAAAAGPDPAWDGPAEPPAGEAGAPAPAGGDGPDAPAAAPAAPSPAVPAGAEMSVAEAAGASEHGPAAGAAGPAAAALAGRVAAIPPTPPDDDPSFDAAAPLFPLAGRPGAAAALARHPAALRAALARLSALSARMDGRAG